MSRRKPKMKGYPDPRVVLAPTSPDALSLAGLRAAVVGGTDGLGRAIALLLAARGAEVVVAGRTFRDEGTARLSFVRADLSSMKEAARVGRELSDELDLVVLTTGIMTAKAREATAEGIERDLAISYLSRYALLETLAPRLEARHARAPRPTRPRVFVMGFPGAGQLGDPDDLNAESRYEATAQHMNTVAANEALVLACARRHGALGVFGLNPGLVKTKIRANFLGEGSFTHRVVETLIGLFTPSPETYARRIVPVLVAPELEHQTGVMFGATGGAILPSDGLEERVVRFTEASARLLTRVG